MRAGANERDGRTSATGSSASRSSCRICGSRRSSCVPFLIVAEDQPVADRARAAALSAAVRSRRRLAGREGILRPRSSLDNYATLFTDRLYIWSYLQEPAGRGGLDRDPARSSATRSPTRWHARRGSWQGVLVLLVVLPFWTSFLIRVYAWVNILQRDGLLNQALVALGLIDAAGHLARDRHARSISASSIRICRSWCCRSMRRSRRWTGRCSKPPPISAARRGRRSGRDGAALAAGHRRGLAAVLHPDRGRVRHPRPARLVGDRR